MLLFNRRGHCGFDFGKWVALYPIIASGFFKFYLLLQRILEWMHSYASLSPARHSSPLPFPFPLTLNSY